MLLLWAGGALAQPSATQPHVTVSLAAEQTALSPGAKARIGLHFALEDGWHVYWRNPGDSGEAPKVRWTLPDGFAAGDVHWPLPQRIRTGPLVNFGYEREVLLPVELTVPAGATSGRLQADVSWLVCQEDCIPGKATLVLDLPVGPAAPDARWAPRFAKALAEVPAEGAASLEDAGDGHVALTVPGAGVAGATYAFFPAAGDVIDLAAPEAATVEGDTLRLRLKKGRLAPATMTSLEGVVVSSTAGGRSGLFVRAGPPTAAPAEAPLGLVFALLFAFLGGALLNLMPCVFPVISLKVLGFVEQAREDRRKVRQHGLVFAAGVLVSFWVLAGTLLALRAAGEQLGWGFQLQSPVFLALLAAFIFVLALSLCGVFEVGLSLTALGGAGGGGGLGGSFTTGALATVVATPCTAPFMGPALGYALTQPPALAMLVFTALGAGMASPYVLLAWFPAALRRLPRPGPWMVTFKQVMAFPLFATVLWLLAVLGLQAGAMALVEVLGGLLTLAFAAWLWGRLQLRHLGGAKLAAAVGLTLLIAGAGLALGIRAAARPAAPSQAAGVDDFWSPWTPDAVASLRAAGKPVFVNFTAAWCISCQVNERLVFSTDDVRADFAAHGVAALKADWTNKNEEIARTLASFGRQGVPLYVYYPGRAGAAPRVLPPVVTRDMLVETFTEGSR